MKTLFTTIALLIVFIGSIVTNTSTAYAQCPAGWNGPTTTNINFTDTSGMPCTITITFCWMVSPGGVLLTQVQTYTGSRECLLPFLTNPTRNGLILDAVLKELISLNATPIPPCSTLSVLSFSLDEYACKLIENDAIHQIMRVTTCPGSGVCRSTYRICVDFSGQNPTISQTLISKTLDGSSSCPDTFPELPLELPNGWQSTCFMDKCQ